MKFLDKIFLFLFLPVAVFSQQRFEIKVLRNLVNNEIAQYETMEIGIRIPSMERSFQMFLEDPAKGINPYAQHFLRMQFSCHGKNYPAEAFYMQEARADEQENKYVTHAAEWPWRVRFAVPDTGKWECIVLMGETAEKSIPLASGISFNCVKGQHHGYLEVAPDHKHFQYSDGLPFFALGENITWADDVILRGHAGPPPVYIAGYYDVYHYLNNLADNGGNYVRIGMMPWSTGIDAEENNIYAQDKACALDSMLSIAEARGLHVQLTLDLPRDSWKNDGNGYWYITGPSPFMKKGMTKADLLHDSASLARYDNYVRYVYERWAFSPAVASIELLGEQDAWEGYEGREKYFSSFITRVDSLLKTDYGNRHMISTSLANAGHYEIFRNPSLSFIDRHHYDNDLHCNQKRYEIAHKRFIEAMNKPFLFGEMGMTSGPVNGSDADDFEHCNDISYHNALWSTFFMGGAGTGMNWWQWKNDVYRENNFPELRFFLDSVIAYRQFAQYENEEKNGLESFYEIDSSKAYVAGWVHNTSYWWGNMMHDCRDRNGKEKIMPKDNDKTDVPENRAGNIFIISDLSPRKAYKVSFYETRKKNTVIQTVILRSNWLGKLKIPMPDRPDCAFVIEK
jgi:hypothetical protein